MRALAAAFLMPSLAIAANLGPLTVQSGRNEPLRAEIMVVGVNPAEADSLTAVLASRQTHEDARVPYSAGTRAIVVTLEPRSPETMTIVLRTREPVEEPTVAVLIELRSKLTQDTRPYRIDTTGLGQPAAPVMAAPASVPAAAAAVSPQNAPTQSSMTSPSPASALNRGANDLGAKDLGASNSRRNPAPSEYSPARPVTPTAAPAVKKAPTVSNRDEGVSSAAVAEGDTLAKIAARVKADDVALDRAMLAIFRANPQAFFGSIHQMKANRTLAIPSREAMLSQADAYIASELRRHTEIFQAYKSRVASAPALANTNPSAQAPRVGSAGSSAKYDRLVLSKSGGALNNDEQQTAINNALSEANSRIAELERNLSDLSRLAELKDRQLAQASATLKRLTDEAQASAAQASPAPASSAPASTQASTPPTANASVADAPVAGRTPTPMPATPGVTIPATNPIPAAPTLPAAAPTAASTAATSPVVADAKGSAEAAVAAATSAIAAKNNAAAPAAAKAGAEDESWWNYAMYGGMAALALLIGWLYKRYQQKSDPRAKFDEMVAQHSMFNTQTQWDSTTLEVEGRSKKPKAKAGSSEGPRSLRAEA